MYIHILWLEMDDKLFKLIGFAPEALESDLQKTGRSLRALTSDERNAIDVYITRIVQANQNETVEELSKRTNNVVKTNITAIMNGIEKNAKFNEEQTVKIVTKEKYLKK